MLCDLYGCRLHIEDVGASLSVWHLLSVGIDMPEQGQHFTMHFVRRPVTR